MLVVVVFWYGKLEVLTVLYVVVHDPNVLIPIWSTLFVPESLKNKIRTTPDKSTSIAAQDYPEQQLAW